MVISEMCDLIAFEVYDLVTYLKVEDKTTSLIIHNETDLCSFINIFGDATIDAIEGDLNVVICDIHFSHLTKEEVLMKMDEYYQRLYV